MGLSVAVSAIQPIPEEKGWSGFVMVGGGYSDLESNTVAGNRFLDGGHETIDSIDDDPRSNDSTHGIAGLEIKYTLGNRNQIFLGSSLEDRVTMDFSQQLGWRKQTSKIGLFQVGILFSGIPAEVWEDPYLAGVKRKETDRDSLGMRFVWDRIMGSGFEFTAQYRDIELDMELSGTDPLLDCDLDCQNLLDRNGEVYAAGLMYRLSWGPGEAHGIRPQIRFRREEMDGDAKARDVYDIQLTYSYISPKWIFVTNALYGESNFDKSHPLYGIKQDSETLAVDATVFYTLPTASKRWQLTTSVFWSEIDSDINFHDNKLSQVLVGAIYNFGAIPGGR